MQLKYFASGDGPFYYNEQINALPWLPPIWEAFKGFGENLLPRLWIDYPFRLIVKVLSQLGLSWWHIEKLLWICAFMLSVWAIYGLVRTFFGRVPSWIASVVYVCNTYTLLLFGGGQLGIFLAYGLAPFVISRFMRSIDDATSEPHRAYREKISGYVGNGLACALLTVFDLRIAYLVFAALGLYVTVKAIDLSVSGHAIRRFLFSAVSIFIMATVATAAVHAFWILPVIMTGGGPSALSEEFTSYGILKFLSVADFSHALSLLHPNWPENLFGKVYFLQPEFLVIPICAFASLLFHQSQVSVKRLRLLFFALLSCVGIFFAKGVNAPLEGVYEWFYSNIPGFVMFRDPTKFYLFTALGYAWLLAFLAEMLITHNKFLKYPKRLRVGLVVVCFGLFWIFTLRPLFLGQLKGNFQSVAIPQDYIALKRMLIDDNNPSRTLWLPSIEKFAFASDLHPALSGDTLLRNGSASSVIGAIGTSVFPNFLYDAGVKYVIVPVDVNRSMFLSDYVFDPRLREQYIMAIASAGLARDQRFQQLAVFVNPSYRFESTKPKIVAKQEYWSRIGLVVSIVSLSLMVFVVRGKMGKK